MWCAVDLVLEALSGEPLGRQATLCIFAFFATLLSFLIAFFWSLDLRGLRTAIPLMSFSRMFVVVVLFLAIRFVKCVYFGSSLLCSSLMC